MTFSVQFLLFSCSFGAKISPNKNAFPVGCIPAARRPYAGVCFRGGVCSKGGLLRGVCSRGFCSGGSDPGGSAPGEGDVCSRGVSQHALRQTPLWTEWMTDSCKNITLATTSLRPVILNFSPKLKGWYPSPSGKSWIGHCNCNDDSVAIRRESINMAST